MNQTSYTQYDMNVQATPFWYLPISSEVFPKPILDPKARRLSEEKRKLQEDASAAS